MTGDATSLLGVIFGTLQCSKIFQCNTDLDSSVGIVLWFMIMVYMFKQLGTICDEYFVPSLEVIVEKLDIPSDVAGATFMAAGSSAPELFTSLVATFLIVNEGGIGTIVGSAIFNILVIVGATGIVVCKDHSLTICWYPLTRDCVFYVVSIIELVSFLRDEEVSMYEALIMVFTYVVYCLYMTINPWIAASLGIVQDEAQGKEASEETSWQDPVTEVGLTSLDDSPEAPDMSTRGVPSPSSSESKPDAVAIPCGSDLPNSVPYALKPVTQGAEQPTAPPDASHLKATIDKNNSRQPSKDSQVKWSMSHQTHEHHHEANSKKKWHCSSMDSAPTLAIVPDAPTIVCTGSIESSTKSAVTSDQAATENATSTSSSSELTGIWRYLRDPLTLILEHVMPSAGRHHWTLFSLSILLIAAATYFMVDATNRIGIILKVPPLVMGLVFLAAGTSIPDAMGSIAVAKQGEGDMAIANALGSNVFDILVGLGVPWTIRCAMGKEVLFPGKFDDLKWDIVILAVVLVVFVSSLVLNRWQLTRKIGYVLVFFYFLNIIYNGFAVWVFETKKEE